ncbi:MAG TPA: hypothetical protein V6D29_18610 [Leptolyngbyaceae cyanobacterium]
MKPSLSDVAIEAAIATIEAEAATPTEKINGLIEIARQLQDQAQSAQQQEDAVYLYCQALELCEEGVSPLLQARVLTGLGAALRLIPATVADPLVEAKLAYEKALPLLQEYAAPEEIAAAEMNLGLVFQALAPYGMAQLSEVIQKYQRALRVFTGETYPKEHAIVQNNIAIAYLSAPLTDHQDETRHLAVEAFEQALQYLTLANHPQEYALLQNNLGNALQYLQCPNSWENSYRALTAYDEALKVRTVQAMPLEYANTLTNKAHVLLSLPDDNNHPGAGNLRNLNQAKALYKEAHTIFQQQGQTRHAKVVATALADIESELLAQKPFQG